MAAPLTEVLENALNATASLTKKPEDFLAVQDTFAENFSKTLKTVYDTVKANEPKAKGCDALPRLIVDNFDDEQIWQELELQNDFTVTSLISGVARLCADTAGISFQQETKTSIAGSILKSAKHAGTKKGKSLMRGKDSEDNSLSEDEEEDSDIAGSRQVHDGSSDGSDEELDKIKSKLEEEDDKFLDFTGDSDDDLNFDFAPIGAEESDEDEEEEDALKKSKKDKSLSKQSGEENAFEITEKGKKGKSKSKKQKQKGSIVDDAFFKLSEMEEFLVQEDAKEERRRRNEEKNDGSDTEDEDEDNIDMFADIPEDDSENVHYADFFDPPSMEDDDDKKDKVRQTDDTRQKDDVGQEDSEENLEEDEEESEEEPEDESGEEEEAEEESLLHKHRRQADLLADSESEGEDLEDILGGGKFKRQAKSSFEQRQEKLKKKISQMEDEIVAEKPWQLSGEISATGRPENSLLSENVQFEHTARLPPEITEETTKTLEDLIRQRVRDKAWDDVERKVKPTENPFEYKKRISLDQEKSKQSLGEIYEQEYIKQQQQEETEAKEDPDHASIRKQMTQLFLKLDALSNFHYTPRPAVPEVQIVSNLPSITMEEVAPVNVSDAKLLAPQEIQEKPKTEVKGQTEKTDTDKLRERKKKKAMKREKQKDRDKRQKLIEKMNPGLGNKYSKEKAMKQLEKESRSDRSGVSLIKNTKEKTGLTSSKTFFTQLQDEVTTHVRSKKAAKRQKQDADKMPVKKFKL